MPANLTPEYRKAEEAFRAAKTIDEKIERLDEMISALPKHKGTDHLHADLRRRMATLQKQLDSVDRKKRHDSSAEIVREGAAQIILIGPPNSGKSTILDRLTKAHPDIGNFPFTTHAMQPGMVPFKDIMIQLVDTPPVTSDFMPRHLLSIVRKADGLLLVTDMSSDTTLDDVNTVIEAFASRHVSLGGKLESDENDTGTQDYPKTRVIANKMDAPDAEVRCALLRQMLGPSPEIFPLSCVTGKNVHELPRMIFGWMKIVRVYTKAPGEKAERKNPYTVFEGQCVGDICSRIHKDFAEKLRFARVWRGSDNPITVSRYEPVRDGDVLELHL
jgi:ribosome-interacting GTPase 1